MASCCDINDEFAGERPFPDRLIPAEAGHEDAPQIGSSALI